MKRKTKDAIPSAECSTKIVRDYVFEEVITKGDAGDSSGPITPLPHPPGGQVSSFTFQEPSYDVVNIKFV